MAAVIAGQVQYPLLPPVISCTYVVSHGISPGSINITTQVGKAIPPGIGNLRISDGQKGIIVNDCRIDYFSATQTGGQGTEWEFRMSDERWRWSYSVIHGWYNQLDPHGKLIPSTVKSPAELAYLCLKAMDVGRYSIDMPPGISSNDAKNQPEFLVTGVNFPAIGINPPCDWYGENAAAMLSQLCDQCGRRIVYDPITRSVHIVRAGVGGILPPGSISMQQSSITAPETPDAVAILGAPTRYQPLLKLQAVGKDWDGQIKPINALSYAPIAPIERHKIEITVLTVDNGFGAPPLYRITVTIPRPAPQAAEVITIEYQATPGETLASAAAAIALIAQAALAPRFTVVASGATVTIQSQNAADAFSAHSSEPFVRIDTGAAGGAGNVTWAYCQPPLFEGVRETRRLNLQQARALAQSCVFKMYRVVGVDCTTGKAPMVIPGYGNVYKRQNIILLDTKVEQIVPEGGDANFIDDNEEALIVNLYDGFSRDQAGVVYGSVAKHLFDGLTYVGDGALDPTTTTTALDDNTLDTDRVPFPFSVDPTYQCILFSNYVYKESNDGIAEPTLYLQTAVNIRDEKTNQLVGYTDLRRLKNGNTVMVVKRPDVQLNVYGVYEQSYWFGIWKLKETKVMETDAIVRARYYLNSTILQFQLKPGVVQRYNGIVPIPMDGRVMQVTYSVKGGQGCDTTVSLNGEHDVWVPPYPARRRAENLASIDRVVPVGARSNMLDDGPEFYNARS